MDLTIPIVNLPLGHGLDGHQPDYTFNDVTVTETWGDATNALESVTAKIWGVREERTLRMEYEIWQQMQRDFARTIYDSDGNPISGVGGASPIGPRVNPILTWSQLAGDWDPNQPSGSNDLTRAVDANGFPLDSNGNPRNSWGQIVDANGNAISNGDPINLAMIQWQRQCDVNHALRCGDGVLQQFNKARTQQEKIDILNWFMADNGLEVIPTYDMALAAQKRQQYLIGLPTTVILSPGNTQSQFTGTLLP
jgi:hypothetical protein